jgi:cytochrome c
MIPPNKIIYIVSILMITNLYSYTASAQGDPVKGEEAFKAQCSACHNIVKGAQPDMYGVVLPLYGIINKEAGKVPGFFYSKAMRESGVVWTEDFLIEYLQDPKGTIPNIRMEYLGLPDKQTSENVVSFLKAQKE